MDIHHIRENYTKSTLSTDDVVKNPIEQFRIWLDHALKSEVIEPTALTLATVDSNNQPSARTLLLKYINEEGFTFFTNYNSNKGKDIEGNSKAGIVFFWPELQRQVNIQGTIKKTTNTVSDEYFYSRPLDSQIGACVSSQSSIIASREELSSKIEAFEASKKKVTRPETWGGYTLSPTKIEFWQGRANRLHDRIQFTLENGNWKIERLAP